MGGAGLEVSVVARAGVTPPDRALAVERVRVGAFCVERICAIKALAGGTAYGSAQKRTNTCGDQLAITGSKLRSQQAAGHTTDHSATNSLGTVSVATTGLTGAKCQRCCKDGCNLETSHRSRLPIASVPFEGHM